MLNKVKSQQIEDLRDLNQVQPDHVGSFQLFQHSNFP